MPGDETAIFLEVVRCLLRIEHHRRIEIREEDDHPGIQGQVKRLAMCELDGQPAEDRSVGLSAAQIQQLVAGMSKIDDAKIGGITPAVFTFSGICVESPPNMRCPTCRFG